LLRKKVIAKEHEDMTFTKWNAVKRDSMKRYGLSMRQKRDEAKIPKRITKGKALKKFGTSPFGRTAPKLCQPSTNVDTSSQDSRSPASISPGISTTKMSPTGSYAGAVKWTNGRENAAAKIRVPVPSDFPAKAMSNKQAIEEIEFKAAVAASIADRENENCRQAEEQAEIQLTIEESERFQEHANRLVDNPSTGQKATGQPVASINDKTTKIQRCDSQAEPLNPVVCFRPLGFCKVGCSFYSEGYPRGEG
jgi:hypothetical protein